ncbi:MAG TPA: hypothetical protein VJ731_16680 [Terriglobales bacterium]|nr:hypothetical protein [Terriglobales bacterium]
MVNPSGNLIINGITDAELAHILEVKARNANVFHFNPQALQPFPTPQNQTHYNNAAFTWNSEQGLALVHGIVSFLLKKEEKAIAQGQ